MAADECFGRHADVGDVVSADPQVGEVAPATRGTLTGDLDVRVRTKAEEIGLDADLLRLWRDLGYVPTEQSRDTFTATELDAWRDAVARPWADEPAVDDEGADMAELVGLIAHETELTVASTLAAGSPEPARRFAERVRETDLLIGLQDGETEAGSDALGFSVAFLLLAGWLNAVWSEHPDAAVAEEVVAAVQHRLGRATAQTARRASGMLGAAGEEYPSVRWLTDELGDDILPSLIWLAAGAVLRYGEGEATWLRRHEGGDADGPA
jgi:hypothetical protein